MNINTNPKTTTKLSPKNTSATTPAATPTASTPNHRRLISFRRNPSSLRHNFNLATQTTTPSHHSSVAANNAMEVDDNTLDNSVYMMDSHNNSNILDKDTDYNNNNNNNNNIDSINHYDDNNYIPFETTILDQDGQPIDSTIDDPSSTLSKKSERAIVQSISYQGLEVIFATTRTADGYPCILVISSRSKMTLQTLYLVRRNHSNNSKDNANMDNHTSTTNHNHNNDEDYEVLHTTTDDTNQKPQHDTTTTNNNDNGSQISILSMHANPITGVLSLVTSTKHVHVFKPRKSDPTRVSFGKFTWVLCDYISVGSTFSQHNGMNNHFTTTTTAAAADTTVDPMDSPSLGEEDRTNTAQNKGKDVTSLSSPSSPSLVVPSHGSTVCHPMLISTSMDYKLLLVHYDQLAIYDVSQDRMTPLIPPTLHHHHHQQHQHQNPTTITIHSNKPSSEIHESSLLLWTTRVRSPITSASLSGDGRAIAYVMKGEGVAVPYPYGVRTFVRDKFDGSDSESSSRSSSPLSSKMNNNNNYNSNSPSGNSSIGKSGNGGVVGIVYKPGPFLVHSTTVTRISFRGHGLNLPTIPANPNYTTTSSSSQNSSPQDYSGNDLLLTTCGGDGNMRVFSQSTWKCLLHWETPLNSRADWIHGITMANLGDLDPYPKSSKHHSQQHNPNVRNHAMHKSPSMQDMQDSHSASASTYNISQNQNHHSSHSSIATGGGGGGGSTTHHNNSSSPSRLSPARQTGWHSTQPLPTTAAGAWISELTFRGPFPALRLSRLSFLKSGTDAWAPAHFESVAAILPPGTIDSMSVLEGLKQEYLGGGTGGEGGETCSFHFDGSLIVQGIWSAWNPWDVHPNSNGVEGDESMSGNALALIGAVPSVNGSGVFSNKGLGVGMSVGNSVGNGDGSGVLPTSVTGNGSGNATSGHQVGSPLMPGSVFGGTHSPPHELRIVTTNNISSSLASSGSNPNNSIVIMDFPLWGDYSYGAMELGSPLRYLLNLGEEIPRNQLGEKPSESKYSLNSTRVACLDFESNRLCAVIEADRRSIGFTWRKRGTMNIMNREEEKLRYSLSNVPSLLSISSTISMDSQDSHTSFKEPLLNVEQFVDCSITPLPLSLPSLYIPSTLPQGDRLSIIKWWPDENFGGPPKLLAITALGTLILYETSHPWTTTEPIMPAEDPFASYDFATDSYEEILKKQSNIENRNNPEEADDEIYEVLITPHPDFGIGLRLEASGNDMSATVGSFKMHPLTGGRLPAEKTGKISIGDELLSVNQVSLHGMSFDDIISTIRYIGTNVQGGSLLMKFRVQSCIKKSNAAPNKIGNRGSEPIEEEGLEIVASKTEDLDSQVASGVRGSGTQIFGQIIGIIPNALPSLTEQAASNRKVPPRCIALLPWYYGTGAPIPHKVWGTSLFVVGVGRTLSVSRLEVFHRDDPGKSAKLSSLGSVQLHIKNSEANIVSLEVVKTALEGWCIAVCDSDGLITLAFININQPSTRDASNQNGLSGTEKCANMSASIRTHEIFNCKKGTSRNILLRAFSQELFAIIDIDDPTWIKIWTAMPGFNSSGKMDEISCPSSYIMHEIFHGSAGSDTGDVIKDVRWVQSGSMDSFPWIVSFGCRSAVVHHRPGNSNTWSPIAEFQYPTSQGINSFSCQTSSECFFGSISPADAYPHLIPAIRSVVSATDEHTFLRSDWDPASILANICCDREGVYSSLSKHVRRLLKWLSQWMDSTNTSATLGWDTPSKLSCGPLGLLYDVYNTDTISESENIIADTAASLFSSVRRIPDTTASESVDEELFRKFLDSLSSHLKESKPDTATMRESKTGAKYSKEFILAMASGKILDDSIYENQESISLPQPLCNLDRDSLYFLKAIAQVSKEQPRLRNSDFSGQLFILSFSLLNEIIKLSINEDTKENLEDDNQTVPAYGVPLANMKKKPTVREVLNIPSGSCLAALLSDNQSELLQACRKSDGRLHWESARSSYLPFWLRSDKQLKKVAEEIGQSMFKSTRDILECSMFYIATGNMKSLNALAATDRSESGKTFLSFLSKFDFSSPRGRQAAEKNAYSLLRKRRYGPAAAFFLIMEPPMLQTAIEVIISQMQDFSLAFLISRLIEMRSTGNISEGMSSLTISSGFSLANLSKLGGGGGFASQDYQSPNDDDFSPFAEWEPTLGIKSKELLKSRGFHISKGDRCLQALFCLWLKRPNDASLCIFDRMYETDTEFSVTTEWDNDFNSSSSIDEVTVQSRVQAKVNKVINFMCRPIVLEKMNACKHIHTATSVIVARSLLNQGIEIPSKKVVDSMKSYKPYPTDKMTKFLNKEIAPTNPSSSISQFESSSSRASTSIFDEYETPRLKPKVETTPTDSSSTMMSSIFDSFEAPKVIPSKNPSASTDGMTSTIFDSFDVPQQKPKNIPSTSAGDMTSSIFDTFDVPQQKPKNKPSASAGDMTSSIFSDFDTPNLRKVSGKAPCSRSGESSVHSQKHLNADAIHQNEIEEINDTNILSFEEPPLWSEWSRNLIAIAAARRLLREMARVISTFEGDDSLAPTKLFRRHVHPLIAYGASHILSESFDGENFLPSLFACLDDICTVFEISSRAAIIDQSLILLSCPNQPYRIVLSVLLHSLNGRGDLVEDTIRNASKDQMQRCEMLISANDNISDFRKTEHHISSQFVKRQASFISWQLELCLWMHRGGTFPISSLTVKEATVAARIGFVIAAWGRCHECLETMIKYDPDCEMDFDRGRQLWSSMKVIQSFSLKDESVVDGGETTSGGWEFLVDCKREEATNLLRNRKPGSFLLRPHTNDYGVFTLSFRTNLTASETNELVTPAEDSKASETLRPIKRDEVVQHAIVRLSDAGFRCGSFGPFSSLLKLLEAVSASLPFDLLFSEPPTQGIIKEEGSQPSPNSAFIRKLSLHSKTEHYRWNTSTRREDGVGKENAPIAEKSDGINEDNKLSVDKISFISDRLPKSTSWKLLGDFSQLLTLTELRKQFSAVVANIDKNEVDLLVTRTSSMKADDDSIAEGKVKENDLNLDDEDAICEEELDALASRMIRPFLTWCRSLEVSLVSDMFPSLPELTNEHTLYSTSKEDMDDSLIRRMIQPKSGVEFRTLRVGEGGHSAVVVLFCRSEALSWLLKSRVEMNEADAQSRLDVMERLRVIEQIDLNNLSGGKSVPLTTAYEGSAIQKPFEIRYRFVDPWEVEVLELREDELRGVSVGRGHYVPFTIGAAARACEESQRTLGGLHLLSLWSVAKGGVCLTKAFTSIHPPWERDAGSDLHVGPDGLVSQCSSYENAVRQHLYRNALFRRLNLPQRFLAVLQIDLLDLKNLTSPGGSPSLTAYALMRLKRTVTSAPLTHKARTLDSACTEPKKIAKISGPNAPSSWGSAARFRFPLPEDVDCDGTSYNVDREALFKGAPGIVQLSVFEKKFMNDLALGSADVKLDGLCSGGEIEEWVPLRSQKSGITWFVRIRLSMTFELMCLEPQNFASKEMIEDMCPSTGLKKIRLLSKIGGAHEDAKGVQKSLSTPDFMTYLESMVY